MYGLVPDRERAMNRGGRDQDVNEHWQRRDAVEHEIAGEHAIHREQQPEGEPVGLALRHARRASREVVADARRDAPGPSGGLVSAKGAISLRISLA